MKKTKYSEEQIVNMLTEGEAGISVTELCRKYGMSDATYYNWKAKYGGMAVSDVKRLKQLEEENRRLGAGKGDRLIYLPSFFLPKTFTAFIFVSEGVIN